MDKDLPAAADRSETARLSSFIAGFRLEMCPAETIRIVKLLLVDSIATCLLAYRYCPVVSQSKTGLLALDGGGNCTIVGANEKCSAPSAAFLNGAAVHALNFDSSDAVVGHQGIVSFSSALAAAELTGGTGRKFLAACIIGSEIGARLSASVSGTRATSEIERVLAGQALSYLPAAAAASSVLGLSADETASALGLSLMQTAGSRQFLLVGDPPAKSIYGAFPNQAGLLSAMLAKTGVDANIDVFSEPAGFFPLHFRMAGAPLELCEHLGTLFRLEEARFKQWPVSSEIHGIVQAIHDRFPEGADMSGLRKITLTVSERQRPWCEPDQIRRRPPTFVSATNSLPYCVAHVLAHGDVKFAALFRPAGDVRVQAIVNQIEIAYRSDKSAPKVELHRSDGSVDVIIGHKESSCRFADLSVEDVERKFRLCLAESDWSTSKSSDRILQNISRLEELDDIRTLFL